MAGTYKAFFRYDKYFWIPIQAFYVRLLGIPDFILISNPGLNTNIFKELTEVPHHRYLTLTVSFVTGYTIIGKAALDGLSRPAYYHQPNPSFSMTFAVERWASGKIAERVWVQDNNASLDSGPDIYRELHSEGWEFTLKLPNPVLLGDVPPPGS